MKLEQQVCSLDLAKRLKELNVPQESLFYWRLAYHTSEKFNKGVSLGKTGEFGEYRIEYCPKPRYTTADVKWNWKDLQKLEQTEYSAFTVAELGEMLPKGYSIRIYRGTEHGWSAGERVDGEWNDYSDYEMSQTEADARAKCLIYLLEQGIIKA